jgi:hypothetical protein
VNSIDCFSISGGLVESLPHRFQVLCGEGLETDIDGDTATLRESFQEFLIKGDGDRGMSIPEKIELSKKGEKFETKSPVSCDVGVDDIKESSFEEVGKVFAKQRKDSF